MSQSGNIYFRNCLLFSCKVCQVLAQVSYVLAVLERNLSSRFLGPGWDPPVKKVSFDIRASSSE